MSEIEVGEYIRNEDGYICHIKKTKDLDNIFIDEDGKVKEIVGETVFGDDVIVEIIKHSKDTIDLIEEKDILRYRINKLDAIKIGEVKKYKDARSLKEYLGVEGFSLEQIEILGIVTKEQFSNIEYKVVE